MRSVAQARRYYYHEERSNALPAHDGRRTSPTRVREGTWVFYVPALFMDFNKSSECPRCGTLVLLVRRKYYESLKLAITLEIDKTSVAAVTRCVTFACGLLFTTSSKKKK